MGQPSEFLHNSPIARRTRLQATAIIGRTTMTPQQLLDAKERGFLETGGIEEERAELEVGGQVVATGKIIRRRGKRGSYFRVDQVHIDTTETRRTK